MQVTVVADQLSAERVLAHFAARLSFFHLTHRRPASPWFSRGASLGPVEEGHAQVLLQPLH